MSNSKIVTIVPCYNEESRLNVSKFIQFLEHNSSFYFLFVNDGSKDQTLSVLNEMAKQHPRIKVSHLSENGGKAEAIRQGVLRLKDHFQKDLDSTQSFFAYFDADLATPLDELVKLKNALDLDSSKMVSIGSRVQLLGHDIKRQRSRHYLGRIFATCASLVLGFAIYDTQCGAKVFRWNDQNLGLFQAPFLTRWLFDVEILKRYTRAVGLNSVYTSIIEIPLMKWHDIKGSRLKVSDFLKAPFELLIIFFKY